MTDYYSAHLRLRHRGQDDEGFLVVDNAGIQLYRGDDTISELQSLPHIQAVKAAHVVLGHRRLSIIDLSSGGHQPMCDHTGRYTMVYNGELFNYIELGQELERLGYHFETRSDSEILLAAFAEWGTDSFNRFNGMWALVIYDAQERRLILSRDRFGIKPLYYTIINGTLYFGSEVKFLLPFLTELQINQARAMDFVVHNLVDHHSETIFQNVYQFMPAHYAVFDHNGLNEYSYWHLPDQKNNLGLAEASDQLAELLTSAVALRLRSDVPIGSLLSGGLDSTTIVCLVRQLLDHQGADNSFHFFSAVFDEEVFSERRYIEQTVAQTGMPIHWIYPNPHKLIESLPQLIYHQEFPFRSLAVYSQWEIMHHVGQSPIVVLLNGQGSDEIFAGYTAHYYALIAEYIRRLQLGQAWLETRSLIDTREVSLVRGLTLVLRELVQSSPFKKLVQQRPRPYINGNYQPPEGWTQQRDIFQNALVRNLTFSALPEYLRYEDRNSMAFTLESRLPFMDYRLVEWAMSLPPQLKIKGEVSKRVLRDVAQAFIPPAVVQRKDKMGFVSPQQQWQRDILISTLDCLFAQDWQQVFPFLNGDQISSIYRNYRAGRHDNWTWVWRVACLAWWQRYWWEGQL